MQPCLDRRHGSLEALASASRLDRGNRRASQLRVSPRPGPKAVHERDQSLGPFSCSERVDSSAAGSKLLGMSSSDPGAPAAPRRGRDCGRWSPSTRAASLWRVEIARLFPDAHVGLLKRLGGGVASRKNTGDDPVEFRAGRLVKRRESRRVTRCDAAEEIGKTVRGRAGYPLPGGFPGLAFGHPSAAGPAQPALLARTREQDGRQRRPPTASPVSRRRMLSPGSAPC